jgi:hypothetical protein
MSLSGLDIANLVRNCQKYLLLALMSKSQNSQHIFLWSLCCKSQNSPNRFTQVALLGVGIVNLVRIVKIDLPNLNIVNLLGKLYLVNLVKVLIISQLSEKVGRYCFTVHRQSVHPSVRPKVTSPPRPLNGSS